MRYIKSLKIYWLTLMFLFSSVFSKGQLFVQNTYKFRQQIQHTYALINKKEYKQAALIYDSLLITSKEKKDFYFYYYAACCSALIGNNTKALSLLNKACNKGYSDLSGFLSDSDLIHLHKEPAWEGLVKQVRLNKTKADRLFIKSVADNLDSILAIDQEDRKKIIELQKNFGWKSKEEEAYWKVVELHDSSNLSVVKNIIGKYGWLGPDEVGQKGASTLFLIIQHSDSLTQITCLPLLRKAVREGKADIANLAYLEDRILVQQGKPQIYGTQVKRNQATEQYEFYPIANELTVNDRRNKVGLQPIEEYARHFKINLVH